MNCDKCYYNTVISVCSKSKDDNSFIHRGIELNGYVPYYSGIGGGDYLKFEYCVKCGQIQNWKSLTIEEALKEEEDG